MWNPQDIWANAMDGFGDEFSANKDSNGDDDFDVRAGEEKEVAAANSEGAYAYCGNDFARM